MIIEEINEYLDFYNKMTKKNFYDILDKYRTCDQEEKYYYMAQLSHGFPNWYIYSKNPEELDAFLEEEKKRRYKKIISSIEKTGGRIKEAKGLAMINGQLVGEIVCTKGVVKVKNSVMMARPNYRTRTTLKKG